MDHFQFKVPPFTREIKVEHRLKISNIEEQVATLKALIDQRQSAALVAPAGCGKTVALRALRAQLPEARYRTTYIKLSDISARDMCREVALALGVQPSGHYPALVRNVEERLKSGYLDSGIRQVIIFDDAQDMRPKAMRLVRLLTNFEMDSRLIVSIILAGQTRLKTYLLQDDFADVRQRLSFCGEISALSREETKSYIEHRSRIAGATQAPFDTQAIEAIYEISRGNMRAIDQLALATLVETERAQKSIADAGDVALARSRIWS
jgi:type II secretory pathway predicted ATPase ExeA